MKFLFAIWIMIIKCKCQTTGTVDNYKELLYNNKNVLLQDKTNCTATTLHIKINENAIEIEVSWELTPVMENCRYEYRLTITEASNKLVQISEHINQNFYKANNLKPCSKYNISLEAFEANNSEPFASLTETFRTDIVVFEPITTLNIKQYTNSLLLSWEPSLYADVCKVLYNINAITKSIKKGIPYFRRTNGTRHWIKNLTPCTQFNISVTPSSFSQYRSEDVNSSKSVDIISTLPEKVENINVQDYKNITELFWSPPEHHTCIKNYYIFSNELNISEIINSTSIRITNYIFCTKISISAITIDDAKGESAIVQQPGPVHEINITTTEITATVSWKQSVNSTCVKDYVVLINNTLEDNSENLQYTFYELDACTFYEFSIAARSKADTLGDFTKILFKTQEPEELGEVQNLEVTTEDLTATLTWECPINAWACDITYIIGIRENNNDTEVIGKTKSTSYQVDMDVTVGCLPYFLTVKPVTNLSKGTRSEAFVAFPKQTIPSTCIVKYIQTSSATIECTLESYSTNVCEITGIFLICEAFSPENSDNQFATKYANKYLNIQDDNQRLPISITIDGLSEFTNYSCVAIVQNIVGNSSKSMPYQFKTNEGIPQAPILEEISDITNRSFTIKWKKSVNIPGILQNYRITVISKGPQYFNPKNCHNIEKPVYIYEVGADVYEYTMSEAIPSFKYDVYLDAKTYEYGEKNNATEVITKSGMPNEPEDVYFALINSKSSTYDVAVNITWIFPCYANGIIKYFKVDVLGTPLVDLHIQTHKTTTRVLVNENITDLFYKCIVKDIKPAFNYTINIFTISEDNYESLPVELVFESPESLPESPHLKEISDITHNSFNIKWEEPNRKNGQLTNYIIYIINKGPVHWLPSKCSNYNKFFKYIVSPTETIFNFKSALSNYEYTIYIKASTKGQGPASESKEITTLETEPGEVENCKVKVRDFKSEKFNVTATLTFDYPCNTNGYLKQFNIIFNGHRPHRISHIIMFSIEQELEKENFEFSTQVLAKYNYEVVIQIETKHYKKNSVVYLTSPSGVPPKSVKHTTPPKGLSSSQAEYNISRDIFDEENGNILYYSIIIGEMHYEEKSTYGFWEGTENTWPTILTNSTESIQSYEATPLFWNPFLNKDILDNNLYIYTFVLGDGNHSTANKPLKPGIIYTFKIRGFTESGYRDTEIVTFQLSENLNISLILGLLFGVIGTCIAFVLAIIFWKKKRQWVIKRDSIKSMPLTPIPVSSKRFSRYYSDLKNNPEKLKEEFSLLNKRSSEMIRPSYDGILPENKKKNRYTNVITYDETRVKLLNIEDNYSSTDYINASYIQGYLNNKEYIATQGPLQHTCIDFWKMVIQENSSVIVMVAQFIEQNKNKCYKYFPSNHENLELDNGIAIRCCTELNFNTYIVRTLLVQKELQQWTITHLQFTDWPDFGCPIGTDVMLDFCQLMRAHAQQDSAPIIIHCSAGIGRTGTLIALDIVLQAIEKKRDIDIFHTVLNLRKDRQNMVQTESQYLYIYSCINDAIKRPIFLNNGNTTKEPIYENLEDTIRKSSNREANEKIITEKSIYENVEDIKRKSNGSTDSIIESQF